MMIVHVGDIVKIRDGRLIEVTDAVDQTAPEVKQNPDNIFIGVELVPGEGTGGTIVSNMDEVVSIVLD